MWQPKSKRAQPPDATGSQTACPKVPFVLALVVFPALAGGDAEDGVVLLVLRGFDFCILSETTDEDDFVEDGLELFY
jgi:hypothetical protein